MRGRLMIWPAFILALIITKAATAIEGQCQLSVTTPGQKSGWFDVPGDGKLSLYFRTQEPDAIWVFLKLKDPSTNEEDPSQREVRGTITSANEIGRIDFRYEQNTRTVIAAQDRVIRDFSYPECKGKLVRIRFQSNKNVDWALCPLGVVPTFTSTSTSSSRKDVGLGEERPEEEQMPEEEQDIEEQMPEEEQDTEEQMLGNEMVELVALSIVSALLVPLILGGLCGVIRYRRRWLATVKAKSSEGNNDRAIENRVNGGLGIEDNHVDNPTDHVYDEWNPNYTQQGMAQGLTRYDSENSLYEPGPPLL